MRKTLKKSVFITLLFTVAIVVNAQRVKLPAEELPKTIKDNIAKEHPGFEVKQAIWDFSTTLVPKNSFIYDVVITKGTNEEALLYDRDGKFIKKGVVKLEPEETKVPKPEKPVRTSTQK